MDPAPLTGVRTGSAYEAAREAERARLGAAAEQRRVRLGADLVLVFDTVETVRAALEETLRADRIADAERVEAETTAFAGLLGGDDALAGILYVDVADPVALAERLGELPGLGEAVYVEVDGARVGAQADDLDGSSGVLRLRFALDSAQRAALLEGAPLTVGVAHPACSASTRLSREQVRAIRADLQR